MIQYENVYSLGPSFSMTYTDSTGTDVIPFRMTHENTRHTIAADGTYTNLGQDSIFNKYDFSTENGNKFLKCFLNGKVSYSTGDSSKKTRGLVVYQFFFPDEKFKLQIDTRAYLQEWFGENDKDRLECLYQWAMDNDQLDFSNIIVSIKCYVMCLEEGDNSYVPGISMFITYDTQVSTGHLSTIKIPLRYAPFYELPSDTVVPTYYTISRNTRLEDSADSDNSETEPDDTTQDITDSVTNQEGMYRVTDDANDWLQRTVNLRAHVTWFNSYSGYQPTPFAPDYIKFLDDNCYAYVQPVWKFGPRNDDSRWRMNNFGNLRIKDDYFEGPKKPEYYNENNEKVKDLQETWIAKNGYIDVHMAGVLKEKYVGRKYTSFKEYEDGITRPVYEEYDTLVVDDYSKIAKLDKDLYDVYPFIVLQNGRGAQNSRNGMTLGSEFKWAYSNSAPLLSLPRVDSTTQSALCFSNVFGQYEGNKQGFQYDIYAYTDGDDLESTIVEGEPASLTIELPVQTVTRTDLSLNDTLKRW